jgi:DNA-directed RNA polymerase specialized sigma subunit
MQEIGAVLDVTLSRISQIRTKALVQLRAALQHRTHGAYATAA